MKNYIYIVLIIIIILSFSLFSFSTGYNAHNLSNIAYVIAVGLDKGTSSPLKLTIQLTKTSVEGRKTKFNKYFRFS